MLDFPSSPTVGQKYPSSPIAGVPTYTWDGEKWTTVGAAVGGKTAVYTDGSTPMTAQLTLKAPPVAATDAAAKSYVDGISNNTVQYVAQTPIASQIIQARQNIFAAPFDAMSYQGMQVNGSMLIDQQAQGATVINNQAFCTDMWIVSAKGTQTVSGVNNNAQNNQGFSNQLQLYQSTTNNSPGAGDFTTVYQTIENYRLACLRYGYSTAMPLTIGFWFMSLGRGGTLSGSVRNLVDKRTITWSVPVNQAFTWEYKTITIPGDPAATPRGNLTFNITVMAGANVVTAPGVWVADANTAFIGTPGTTNFLQTGTGGDYLMITGFTVHPGSDAPPANQSAFLVRRFDDELRLCQRYWESTYPYGDPPGKAYGQDAGGGPLTNFIASTASYCPLQPWHFKVTKRGMPGPTIYNPNTGGVNSIRGNSGLNYSAYAQSGNQNYNCLATIDTVSGGIFIYGHAVADARI